jgi:hypothetical protein
MNLEKINKLAREVKDALQEEISSLDKRLIDFEGSSITEALGKIDIEMNQQNSRKRKEENMEAI